MKPESSVAESILRQRARQLAQVRERPHGETGGLELLEFSLAHERYAVETGYVREVGPLKELTPLPGVPPFIRGIVNLRGRILAVLDLKKFFDLPEKGLTDLHRIILVAHEGLELCLLADAVAGVISVAPSQLQPALPTLTGIRETYLKGLTAERLVVLNLARILADPKIIVSEEANFESNPITSFPSTA